MNEAVLRATDLSLGYGRRRVLEDVSLELGAGEFWFFLGPNGEGKTTMLRAILRLLPPQGGELWFHPELAQRERIGFVPQRCDLNPALPTTVREFVELGLVGSRLDGGSEKQSLAHALEQVGLGGMARQSYWSLSGGQRQRALLARALVRRPTFLILDEPTSGLDLSTEEAFLALLEALNRDDGVTIIVVTHDLAIAARHATHAALFHSGRVLPGEARDLLRPESLERVYGVPVSLSIGGGRGQPAREQT